MKKSSALLLATVALLTLAGCTSVSAKNLSSSSPSASENPYGGFVVAAPGPDEIILTVMGPTETDEYSINDLKALASEPVSIFEPFAKANQTFIGVPMATLFDAAGIKGTDKISTIALNEYIYNDVASNFTDSKGIVTFTKDGGEIPMDQGGPIRIIFPANSKYFDFLDAWNWSLRTIEVVK